MTFNKRFFYLAAAFVNPIICGDRLDNYNIISYHLIQLSKDYTDNINLSKVHHIFHDVRLRTTFVKKLKLARHNNPTTFDWNWFVSFFELINENLEVQDSWASEVKTGILKLICAG